MLKKSLSLCFVCMLFASVLWVSNAEARPAWVGVKYSGFTLHRNANQTDPAQPAYYYAKIEAVCTNNSSNQIITGVSSRSMSFVAQAYNGSTMLGSAQGSVRINESASLNPVRPGETFIITYSVPVVATDGVSLEQFNRSAQARLRKYKLQHNFSVVTQ